MVSKKASLGMLAVTLVLGLLVVGCSDTTNAEIQKKKTSQVASVTVTKTKDNKNFIISWDAAGGEDVTGYIVYLKQEGKKNVTWVSDSGTNVNKYDPENGEEIPNDNQDKWSCLLNYAPVSAEGSFFFGVRTYSGSSPFNSESDIKWAASATKFTELKPAQVDLKKAANSNKLIVRFDGAAQDVNYSVSSVWKKSLTDNSWDQDYFSGSVSNDYVYDDNGNPSANSDKTKWSGVASVSAGYEYYVLVTANTYPENDVSVVTPAVKSNTVSIPNP